MTKKSEVDFEPLRGRREPWSLAMAHECQLSSFWEKRLLALGDSTRTTPGGQWIGIALLFVLIAMPTLRLGVRRANAEETTPTPPVLQRDNSQAAPPVTQPAPSLPAPRVGRRFQLLDAPDLEAAEDTITMKVGGLVQLAAPKNRSVSSSQPDVFTVKSADLERISVITLEAKQSGVGVLTQEFIDSEKTETKITVVVDSDPLRQDLHKAGFGNVQITPIVHGVILSGECDSAMERNRCIAIADKRFPSVVNNIRVTGEDNVVHLQLKVFEYNTDSTSVSKLLGQVFDMTKQSPEGRMYIKLTDAAAFENDSVVRLTSGVAKLLAEPTLTTVSGRPAAFQVGNEFPILIPNGKDSVAVEYKQTGIRVDMVPIVSGKQRLRLELRPSITALEKPSKLEFHEVETPVGESPNIDSRVLDIPRLATRHVETTADMSHDRTLIVAMVDEDREHEGKAKCLITMVRPRIMSTAKVARSPSSVRAVPMPAVQPTEFAPSRPNTASEIERLTKEPLPRAN